MELLWERMLAFYLELMMLIVPDEKRGVRQPAACEGLRRLYGAAVHRPCPRGRFSACGVGFRVGAASAGNRRRSVADTNHRRRRALQSGRQEKTQKVRALREKLYRFFMGRNGPDALGQATSFVCVALILINLFVRSYVLYVLELLLMVVWCFRMLSRNLTRRRQRTRAI